MPKGYPKAMKVEPDQARLVSKILKHRFPWIATDDSIEYADECVRMVDFVEILDEIGAKPDPPRKRTLEERRERVTIIAALQLFAITSAGKQPAKWLKGGFLRKPEIEAVVKRLKGELC